MASFSYIISSFFPDINVKKSAFFKSTTTNIVLNTNFIEYSYLNSLQLIPESKMKKQKYNHIYRDIIKNIFISKDSKDNILNKFSKAQFVYLSLCKLARLYKIKKAKYCEMNTDFCMIPLSSFKKNMLIELYDEPTGVIYMFRISDILNIITSALSNAPDFFVEPSKIRNPYTNIAFSIAQLYTIYFRIKDSNYNMPFLFHQYFMNNFNLYNFKVNNEVYIRDIAIANYEINCDEHDIKEYIYEMLREHNSVLKSISIHPSFPTEKVIETFKRYLPLHLTIHFSLQPTKKFNAKKKLRQQLSLFNKLNPTFGRKIYYNYSKSVNIEGFKFDTSRMDVPNLHHINLSERYLNLTRNSYNYRFVDHVIRSASEIENTTHERFLLGITDMQTIMPPLRERDTNNPYHQIPSARLESMNRIIDRLNETYIGEGSTNESRGSTNESRGSTNESSSPVNIIVDVGHFVSREPSAFSEDDDEDDISSLSSESDYETGNNVIIEIARMYEEQIISGNSDENIPLLENNRSDAVNQAPGSEAPGSEAPGSEAPGSETPGSEAPGSEAVHQAAEEVVQQVIESAVESAVETAAHTLANLHIEFSHPPLNINPSMSTIEDDIDDDDTQDSFSHMNVSP